MKGKQPKTTAAQKLYRPIREVSALLDIKPHVLRYWETQFPGLRPKKNRAGNRMYRPEEIELLARIKELLKGRRYTVEGARRKLAEEQAPATKSAARGVRVTAAKPAAAATPTRAAAKAAARSGSAAGATAVANAARVHEEPEAAAARERERAAVIAEVREELRSLARELRAAEGETVEEGVLVAVREPASA